MKSALNLLEAHAEKIILGAAALFTLWLAWGYLLGSPNRITFEGKPLAPGQLDAAILASAQSLESAVRTAKPNQEPIPDFSRQVADLHRGGIFASAVVADAPRLAAELPRLAPFAATAIRVEGLVEEEKDNVRLVTPLPPTRPLARTGRSKVNHIPIRIGVDQPLSAATGGPAADATEAAWVSVGAYFDTLAQRNAMIDADYAASRARAYVAAVDVQRQEVLADGSYSEWKDVRSTAMPELDIVQPIFEDGTGALTNKEEIDRMFAAIKAEQKTTMQPPFMRVQIGDFWEPPLEGLDIDEGDEVAEERPKREPTRPVTPPRPPAGGTGRMPGGDIVGGDTVRGAGGGGGGGGGGGSGARAAAEEQKRKQAQRLQANRDFAQARQAYGQNDLRQAIAIAERVLSNDEAASSLKRRAEALKRKASQTLERRAAVAAVGTPPAPVGPVGGMRGGDTIGGDIVSDMMPAGGMRGGGMTMAPMDAMPSLAYTDAERQAPLIRHPEKEELTGVWYHDDTVEAGKTYRYRMRVALWNRYVGRIRAVKDPEDAKKPLIFGEWSLPSEPVTVTPSEYFFVSGPSAVGGGANVEVWKWRDGFWLSQRFDVAVGEVIGEVRTVKTGEYDANDREVRADVDFTTGAVVLGMRTERVVQRLPGRGGGFTQTSADTLVLTYLDPADGQVKERVALFDARDATRQRLREESF